MQNWREWIFGTAVILGLIISSTIVYIYSRDNCPVGTFTCDTGGKCVPQRDVCNGHIDCPNQEDENPVLCTDQYGSVNMVNNNYNSHNESLEFQKKANICDIAEYPTNCECRHEFRIYCKRVGLQDIPQNISSNVTHMILANNSISKVGRNSLKKYNLKLLHLEGNQIQYLPPFTFKEQSQLKRLLIMNNNLTVIGKNVLSGLHSLLWLILDHNKLTNIYLDDLKDLISLEWLKLSYNKLTLDGEKFPEMPSLMELFLDFNEITVIGKYTFMGLSNLECLNLRGNKISYLDPYSFSNLKNLQELNLFGNNLKSLAPNIFESQTKVTKMYLGKNPFHYIPSKIFNGLNKLASLNLEEIEIDNIDIEMFFNLKSLQSIYFKKYNYCSYAPSVPRCRPLSDGISSMHQLLFKPVFRYACWAICAATCMLNILVLWGRFTFRDENKCLSLVVRNLAVSDFLMGIYLLIIVIQDIKYRDVYNIEAHNWMSSWGCTITGAIAMISSEVSVVLLVFMSVDRFLLIAVPFGRYSSLNIKETLLILLTIWGIGISIAIIPALEFHSSTRFYGVNGLCFPLHIDDPFLIGWEYSALIFFGINATSIVVIAIVYAGMFISIWKTRNATSLPIKDFEFAIRFFFIVLTDTTCWLPIIIVKASAILGTEISTDLYGWLVIFILPINSALNPLLYTFTTPKYRAHIYSAPVCVHEPEVNKCRRTSPHSTGETGSLPLTIRSGQSINKKLILNKF